LAANAAAMTYDLSFNYNASKPHQLDVVVDQISGNTQHFTYNGSGSIKQIQDNSQTQDFYWNEEQWLNAVQNDKGIHHYIYDHTGERIMKSSVIQTNVYVNDQIVGTIQELEPYTLYVNPYFVITEFSNADKVSKHYYMGSQRVASELAVQTTSYSPRIGVSGASQGGTSISGLQKTNSQSLGTVDAELENQSSSIPSDPWLNNLNEALSDFGVAPLLLEVVNKELPTIESIYPDLSPHTSYKTSSTQRVFYWYHPDYIGNVDLVTDLSGEAYELFLYNPWGENLYEWNSGTSTWTSPYRFNGKELDQETGFHYYGARYHEPKLSVWLSVDPLTKKTLESYKFLINNPIVIIDPNGREPDVTDEVIPTIIPTSAFVGWGGTGIQNYAQFARDHGGSPACLDFAKEQLHVVGFTAGGAATSSNMYTYDEDSGPNNEVTTNAVQYIKDAIDNKTPVLVGVDVDEGTDINEGTTDHFVVIVGYQDQGDGTTSFRFFDNASGNVSQGTDPDNLLNYNPNTHLISGESQTGYGQGETYIVSQVRITKKL
jgi:RHS repeat-associated protein